MHRSGQTPHSLPDGACFERKYIVTGAAAECCPLILISGAIRSQPVTHGLRLGVPPSGSAISFSAISLSANMQFPASPSPVAQQLSHRTVPAYAYVIY